MRLCLNPFQRLGARDPARLKTRLSEVDIIRANLEGQLRRRELQHRILS